MQLQYNASDKSKADNLFFCTISYSRKILFQSETAIHRPLYRMDLFTAILSLCEI